MVYYRDIIRLIRELVLLIIDCFHNIAVWIGRHRGQHGKYRRIIHNSYRKLVLMIFVSTIPTGVIGYVGRDFVEAASGILLIPGICLVITAGLLFISDFAPDGTKKPRQATFANAFIIGICQGIATLPGISRSGTTITACVLSGFERKFAVKYSFILSIPAILGALVLELKDAGSMSVSASQAGIYVAGMIVAAVVGYVCIKTMLVIVRRKKFKFFAIYCLAAGIIAVAGHFYLA